MGIWGFNLFDNDYTLDIRDGYLSGLKNGHEDTAELDSLEILMSADEDYEKVLFWIALAVTQWEVGRLSNNVKMQANIALIRLMKKDVLGIPEQFFCSDWKRIYKKINSPQRKKIIFSEYPKNPWNVGDVYAYRVHIKKESKYYNHFLVMQKIAETKGVEPLSIVRFYNGIFDTIPAIESCFPWETLPLIEKKPDSFTYSPPLEGWLSATMDMLSPNFYPEKHLSYLGNRDVNVDIHYYFNEMSWKANNIEDSIVFYYLSWNKNNVPKEGTFC